jgi:hypothetical protein
MFACGVWFASTAFGQPDLQCCPGGCQLGGALDILLSLDVHEICSTGRRVGIQVNDGAVRLDRVVVAEVGGRPRQRLHREDVDPFAQRRFRRVGLRT